VTASRTVALTTEEILQLTIATWAYGHWYPRNYSTLEKGALFYMWKAVAASPFPIHSHQGDLVIIENSNS
jgi:hypothetical protein